MVIFNFIGLLDEHKRYYSTIFTLSINKKYCLPSLSLFLQYIYDIVLGKRREQAYKEWKLDYIIKDRKFCHPCWPVEQMLQEVAENNVQNISTLVGINGWIVIEILLFLLVTGYNVLSALWIFTDGALPDGKLEEPRYLWDYYRIPLLLVIWLALNRPLMYLQTLGPFIQMLAQILNTTGQFGFLFLEFAIPFVCGIWITFGLPGGEYLIGKNFVGQNFRRTKYFVGQNVRHQVEISTVLSDYYLTFVLKYRTKFLTDKTFSRTKFSTPS